ncbi:inorganic polyphosphate kinase [Dehalococcoides mccartyi]|jgi:NAD+ kinase|uniref:NAD kinase n=1 Tax=Dehalococcoides mccartyi TaxID=61435 RepID=A0A328ES67_9CHLR|nr:MULTISPECIES: NAD(+)/NADH kinase [Dehalococcoides]AGG06097.1 putative inorganic polyphosphate/ATP-NAD kinase [Dehalococcoides mccartyi DCMB5]AGG07529.1 putative inorganic polyphosphate/ATP-NAD kinase [Dehalococcoides mccartyi BTF08]AQU05546.1 NAD(+) kinase [Dehalococcoides mccartyi]AQU06992.1 NAD(+) kinase [Dehalococcoides mccartyi]AQW62096.1 NAD(+) kinase [Dehalococcoides mccartyi]
MYKKIGIIYHPLNPAACDLAIKLAAKLDALGIENWSDSAWQADKLTSKMQNTQLILTTGGDGTILRTAHAILPLEIPILSVNLGKVGFMTELSPEDAISGLEKVLAGDGWIDERSLLEAEYLPHDSAQSRQFFVMNDAVVARGQVARVICVSVDINSQPFTTYKADGAIVSTATGSTGYSYAAGGPVLQPNSADIILTPILPHLGRGYSLVLPSDSTVDLQVNTWHEATLSIDGFINMQVSSGDTLRLRRSSKKVKFMRLRPNNYFYKELDTKLKGNNESVYDR